MPAWSWQLRKLRVGLLGVNGGMMQVVHDPEQLQFYDFWVARDANGVPFSNMKPYVHHTYSLQRLEKGLPFPVSCCWNGMVSMNAEPFTHHSLRFRCSPLSVSCCVTLDPLCPTDGIFL